MFTVMTFNIRGSYHADGVNTWDKRADLNAQTILKASPDVIGFQELTPDNKDFYDKSLPDYDFMLGPRVSMGNDKGIWEHPAVYWRRQRFILLTSGFFYLSETPDQYACDWGADQGRGVTWVHLRDQTRDNAFIFMNTHFDHVSAEARRQSALLICQHIHQHFAEQIVVLTGDFNTTPMATDSQTTSPYDVFMSAGFKDVLADTNEPTYTFHNYIGNQYPDHQHQIDWILYRDVTDRLHVKRVTIIRDAMPPLYPSDHYPVVAMFSGM